MNKPKEYEDEEKVYLIKDCNIDENNFFCGFDDNEELPDNIDILDEIHQIENLPNILHVKEDLEINYNLDGNQNEINDISFNSQDFCKMDNIYLFANEKTEIPIKKSRKKIDLNKTPIPIFECIYCSNEQVVFKHMSNEILSDNYLYNCSWNDLKNINMIVSTYLIYNLATNQEVKKLVNLVVNYSEYINKFFNYKNSREFLKNYTAVNSEKYTPSLKFKYISFENTMTFFFKNTSILFLI